MEGTKLNKILGGCIALANALIPFLVLIGALNWNENTIAAAMVVVTTAVTLVGYMFAESSATNT